MDLLDLLAKVVITTPQVGDRLSDYAAYMQASTGVLDGVDARALAAGDGRRTRALRVRALIELTRAVVNGVRRKVSAATGTAGDELKDRAA
jgi:hypothetical protein